MIKYCKSYLSDNIITHARNGPMQKYLLGEFKWSEVQWYKSVWVVMSLSDLFLSPAPKQHISMTNKTDK